MSHLPQRQPCGCWRECYGACGRPLVLAPRLTIEFRAKYWTACADGRPVMTFASLDDARARVPEATVTPALTIQVT